MKSLLFTVVLVLVISSIALGQYKKGSVEDKLIQLDMAWTFAELKGDKKGAGDLIADRYIGTTQRGSIKTKRNILPRWCQMLTWSRAMITK